MSNITIHDKQFKKFIDSNVIEKKVDYIADLINNDYSGKKPVILCVLKGSFMFFSDLIKKLNIDCSVSFIQLKSYEDTSSTGVVKEIVDSGGTASAYECNISNKDACEGLIKFAKEKYGKLDVLVCNAASNPYYGKLAEIPDESFDKIMNNNVKSNLWLCKSAIPHLSLIHI